jgi:HTH-type transcriptional regulator / antitoxin HipB
MPPAQPPVVWHSSSQLAQAVRTARERMGLTQAQLAQRARVGLKFLYELETGKDTLRADKVLDVLDALALRLIVAPTQPAPELREERVAYRVRRPAPAQPDYIGMACTTSGVSLRTALAPDELIRALLSGEPTASKRAHFVVLLEEAPAELLRGLVAQVGAWAPTGAVARNLRRIARGLGVRRRLPG